MRILSMNRVEDPVTADQITTVRWNWAQSDSLHVSIKKGKGRKQVVVVALVLVHK